MRVPLVDLKPQIRHLRHEINYAFKRVLESTSFTSGKEVALLEKEFARYCRAPYCVAVNSGTSALHLALLAHEIGRGDEVITQPNTFIATCEAVSYTGAVPVFCDVNAETYQMDISKLEEVITPRTRAIIPVHLYGSVPDVDQLSRLAKKHNLAVIEDAAQAHGTRYKKKRIGSSGNTTCFSFYPSKVLGALGEGGAVVTKNRHIAEQIRVLRDHGQAQKNRHTVVGYNYRMSELQAAFLRIKLTKVDQWIEQRKHNAKLYTRLLKAAESDVEVLKESRDVQSSFYVYVIRCKRRDKLMAYLKECGIGSQVHYPTPIHLQKAYRFLGYKRGDFPAAEAQSEEVVSLPMYPELTDRQIRYVVSTIKAFYQRKS